MQLHKAFIEIAKRYGNKIAVYDQATGKDTTYSKLLIASLILSKKIAKHRGEHVGIMVPNSTGCIASIIGSLMCGKTPVMINYSTGASQNAIYAQEKCSFKTIITSKKLLEKIGAEFVDGMVYIEDIVADIGTMEKVKEGLKSKLPASMIKSTIHDGSDNKDSVILFTSGSEKDPKAVELSHKNIFHNIHAVSKRFSFTSEDIFLGNLPYFHVFGITTNLWIPLIMGASIVTHANPLDFRAICKSIREYHITVMIGTPSFLYGYLRKAESGDFTSVRFGIAGADKLSDLVRNGYREKHNLKILEGYGTTETSPIISVNSLDANKPGSIGPPLDGVEVRIVDRTTSKDLPANKVGKILVKGDLVMNGYLGDVEETSRRIQDGWYDTGDMGLMDDDGYLWHKGRLRRFVKIGGEMVSLVKVENILEKLLPQGTICCVVDVPNPTKGADIVAAITTKEIDKRHIQKLMKKELPKIAIPKEFHLIEDIPLMGSGKVNFREVEKICRKLEGKKK